MDRDKVNLVVDKLVNLSAQEISEVIWILKKNHGITASIRLGMNESLYDNYDELHVKHDIRIPGAGC